MTENTLMEIKPDRTGPKNLAIILFLGSLLVLVYGYADLQAHRVGLNEAQVDTLLDERSAYFLYGWVALVLVVPSSQFCRIVAMLPCLLHGARQCVDYLCAPFDAARGGGSDVLHVVCCSVGLPRSSLCA